jgi:surface protein
MTSHAIAQENARGFHWAGINIGGPDVSSTPGGGPTPGAPFQMVVRTTAPSESFTIPCQNVGTFNATVDWGDGSPTSAITSWNDADLAHTYATAGDYTISITGDFPNIYFNNTGDKLKVISVTQLGEVGWQTLANSFTGCNNLASFASGTTNTSAVTSMREMFFGCAKLTSANVGSLNTASVTDMVRMFGTCQLLSSIDVSGFNTASVINMSSMFTGCTALTSLDLSGFDTSSVTNMSAMFSSSSNLTSINLSSFDTSSVTTMEALFTGCTDLASLDLSNFDTSAVLNMFQMFTGCSSLTTLDLSNFDTAAVTNMSQMFFNCSGLTSLDVSSFDTAAVTNMSVMFFGCAGLTDVRVDLFDITGLNSTGDLNSFMGGVTLDTARYDATLIAWDAQAVLSNLSPDFGSSKYTPGGAAEAARTNLITSDSWTISDGGPVQVPFEMVVRTTTPSESFTIPCRNNGVFNATVDWGDGSPTSAITAWNDADLAHTYATAGDYTISITGDFPNIYFNNSGDRLKVREVTQLGTVGWVFLGGAFYGCSNMTSFTAGNTDTSAVTSLGNFMRGCTGLTSVDLSSFDTSSCTTLSFAFENCSSLTSLDLSSFDTSSVTDLSYAFRGCSTLASLDLTGFNTAAVNNMANMFQNCSGLTSLDLSSFNTAAVNNMANMFNNCSGLTSLDLSSFNTAAVTSMSALFANCTSLTSVDVSSFNTALVENMDNLFFTCPSLTSLDLSSFNTSSVQSFINAFYNCSGLTSLDVTNFDTSSTTTMRGMFNGARNIVSHDLSNFDTSSVTDMNGMFRFCNGTTSINTTGWDTSSVNDMTSMFQGCSGLTDVRVDLFDITGLNSTDDLNNFMVNVTLNTARYDATLVAWDAQAVLSGLAPNFGSSQYTEGSPAAAARANLIASDSWTITDGGSVQAPFEMVVRTTTPSESFTIPCSNNGTFNATVDWGDGSPTSAITAYNDADLAHTYATAGDYTISITGDFPNIYFNNSGDRLKVREVTQLGTVGWERLTNSFYGCANMTSFTVGNADTSAVTAMGAMFAGCSSMTSIDLTNFDTSACVSMTSMFNACSGLTSLDVSGFDTTSVTNMTFMFLGCSGLTTLDLSAFSTPALVTMGGTFFGCSNLTSIDLSTFDTSSVITLSQLFYNCSSLTVLDLSNFDTSQVNNFKSMFQNCTSLTDVRIDLFDITGVVATDGLDNFMVNCTLNTARYDATLVAWDAQAVLSGLAPNFGSSQYTEGSPAAAARANLIASDSWTITDGGSVQAPFQMVVRTTTPSESFTIPCFNVGTFNATVDWGDGSPTSAITAYNDADLAHTYATAGDYTISITGNFPNIHFNNGGDRLKVRQVTQLGTVGWITLDGAFYGCSNMTSFIAGNTDTSAVTTMQSMFHSCNILATADVSTFDTGNVTSTRFMFLNNYALSGIDVSNFDTSSVTSMQSMFQGCINVPDFQIDSFDITGLNTTSGLNSFLLGTDIPTARYDATLIAWDAQAVLSGLAPNFGSSQYTSGGAAEAARSNLISSDSWTITDGGSV